MESSIAIPRTTEVIVIETPKQGVTPDQIMAVIPAEIRATVKLYLDGKIRQWYSRGDGKGVVFRGRRENRGRGTSHCGNAAAGEGTFAGSPVHSRRTPDAADGIDGLRSAEVSFVQPRRADSVPDRTMAEVGNRFGARRRQCRSSLS